MINSFSLSLDRLNSLNVRDWWAITSIELDLMAVLVLQQQNGKGLRQGEQSVIIANQKRGSLAAKLETELSVLAAEVKKVLNTGTPDAPLRAAACCHLRFENIHPLSEGNGRIGRTILAAQLHQAYRIPPEEFLEAFNAQEMDYLAVFVSNKPEIMFELLLDLLAQLTGQIVAPESSKLPFSILPLHPDRRPLSKKDTAPIRFTRQA